MKIIPLGVGSAFAQRFYHNNYVIQLENINLLLDAGTTLRYSLRAAHMSETDIHYIFITHFHSDHVGGLEEFLQRCYFRLENNKHSPYRPTLIMMESQEPLFNKVLSCGLFNQSRTLPDYCDIIKINNLSEHTYQFNLNHYQIDMYDTTHLHVQDMHSFSVKLTNTTNQHNFIFTSDIKHLKKSNLKELINDDTKAIFQDFSLYSNPVHAELDEILSYYNKKDYQRIYLMHYQDSIDQYTEKIKSYGLQIMEQGISLQIK